VAGGPPLTAEERVRRSVRRALGNWLFALLLLAGVGAWAWQGAFTLRPGEAAVLLLLGRHHETITRDGFHWRLPAPLVTRTVVSMTELRNEDFGFRGRETAETPRLQLDEASMQTSDNNIVRVSFAAQYTVKDPFLARFRVEDAEGIVRDAAQAAMREVVGRMTVDGVLREKRALVTSEAERLLQAILDSYESGLEVQGVQLQDVQPPAPVRTAFEDVVAANQDASRLVNEAEGHRNEVLPKARAEAAEIVAEAEGWREAKIAEATGAAARFRSVVAEYRKAPEVTRKRLYLETMEQVLPKVEKIIVEPGTSQLVPYLPLGRGVGPAR
jgi:membrane protease subunit HflK